MNAHPQPVRHLRRSKRLALPIDVHVFGQDIYLDSFNEFTRMLSVSAHGGAFALAARVEYGQRVLIVNKRTGEERECRIVHVGSMRDGKWTVGIEFVEPVENFWKITFPTCTPKRASHARK
jgi:hypothetical protein